MIGAVVLIGIVMTGCQLNISILPSSPVGGAPTSPPVIVCANASLLTGPSAAPSGAVSVPAGDNSALFANTLPASTTYWFAPGTHTLGSGQYAQIDPGNSDVFIGGPGAVLDGALTTTTTPFPARVPTSPSST